MSAQDWERNNRERSRLTQQWRTDRIDRFTKRQRQVREWINFAEIAEWCSKEEQSIVPNKQRRDTAFETLANDLLAGEFEENSRSRVLYLHPSTNKARMTRAVLKDAIEHNYDNAHGRSDYLARCWIPRAMFDRWLAKHRLEASPARFKPQPPTLQRPKPGRPATYNWLGVKKLLSAYAKEHGPVRGLTELLQKCADFATENQMTPDDSTIRAAIKRYRLDVAAGMAGSARRRSRGK